ncbi:hypothetical protein Hanom_Chr16g01441911 [Helianthus anomalus]
MIKIYTLTFTLLNYIEKASFKSSSSHYCVTSFSLHIPLCKFDIIIITITGTHLIYKHLQFLFATDSAFEAKTYNMTLKMNRNTL